jgi:hypothetical protein
VQQPERELAQLAQVLLGLPMLVRQVQVRELEQVRVQLPVPYSCKVYLKNKVTI